MRLLTMFVKQVYQPPSIKICNNPLIVVYTWGGLANLKLLDIHCSLGHGVFLTVQLYFPKLLLIKVRSDNIKPSEFLQYLNSFFSYVISKRYIFIFNHF